MVNFDILYSSTDGCINKSLTLLTYLLSCRRQIVAISGDYKCKLHYFDLLWICCTDESDRRVAALVALITSRDAVDGIATCEQHKRLEARLCCSQVRQRCVLCQWPVIITRLYYNMTDFMDTFAEFVCWTIPMLYERKTRNASEFMYFVCHRRGISKLGAHKSSRCQSYDLIRRFGRHR